MAELEDEFDPSTPSPPENEESWWKEHETFAIIMLALVGAMLLLGLAMVACMIRYPSFDFAEKLGDLFEDSDSEDEDENGGGKVRKTSMKENFCSKVLQRVLSIFDVEKLITVFQHELWSRHHRLCRRPRSHHGLRPHAWRRRHRRRPPHHCRLRGHRALPPPPHPRRRPARQQAPANTHRQQQRILCGRRRRRRRSRD